MCGVVGFVNRLPEEEKRRRLLPMMDAIEHRGPDDAGHYVDSDIALGFRRLSIIDLDAGHQPLSNEEGNVWIVFNGEIYNFRELTKLLVSKGHCFRTKTDTETIVHAYEQWGTECLARLSGMFAFAIWDQRNCRLFLAVDRHGIKPLYYYHHDATFAFASEAKALFASNVVPCEPDYRTLPYHMAFLTAPFPLTMFKDVHKLAPGHFLILENGRLSQSEYWDLEIAECDHDRNTISFEGIAQSVRRATESQMVADVPLGGFLSGGIDSSAVCYFLNEALEGQLETYFIAFEQDDIDEDVLMDESPYAQEMAQLLSARHHSIYASTNGLDELLPKLIWHMDEPIGDPAAISSYLVSKHSRETLTVLLSGVGGDEVFGGYPRYLAMALLKEFRRLPKWLQGMVNRLGQSVPGGRFALCRNMQKFTAAARREPQDAYLQMLTYFGPQQQAQLFTPGFLEEFGSEDIYQYHRHYLQRANHLSPLNQLQYLDYKTFLPCLNLMYTDKMSMAASIEVRVPYLHDDFVAEMFRLPHRAKLRGLTRKFAFKRAMEPHLPRSVVWRRKTGFGSPIHSWIRGRFREMVETLLSEERLREDGIFRPSAVRSLLENEYSNRAYNSNHIWQLVTIQLWIDTFVRNGGCDRAIRSRFLPRATSSSEPKENVGKHGST